MNPEETLPTPEKRNVPQNNEVQDAANESASSQAIESKSQSAKSGSGVMSAVAVDDAHQQLQGVTSQQSNGVQADDDQTIDVPEVADDIDLIEKEWVKKAKDIVTATFGDPYTQNQQINKIKVEYIKKRYGRIIKTRDE